ncbi:MAG: hypothetical protein ACYC2T_02535 [Bacillota bacterium]
MQHILSMPKGMKKLLSLLVVLFWILSSVQPVLAFPTAANTNEADGSIQVDMHHLLITPLESGELAVRDSIIFRNTGSEPITGNETFKISLPEGYAGLEYGEGIDNPEQVVVSGQELVLNQEIPPGENAIVVSYKLPQGSAHYLINQKFNYPTSAFYVLVPPQGVNVAAENIADGGVIDINGYNYHIYALENIKPGDMTQLAVSLGGAASENGSGVTRQATPEFHNAGHIRFWAQSPFAGIDAHLFLGIFVAVPLAFGIYALYRRRRQPEDSGGKTDVEEQLFHKLMARQKILMEKIKELEGQMERQELDPETYQKLREAYKNKLVQVKVKLRQLSG